LTIYQIFPENDISATGKHLSVFCLKLVLHMHTAAIVPSCWIFFLLTSKSTNLSVADL